MDSACRNEGSAFFSNLPALVVDGFSASSGVGAGWMPVGYELDAFTGVGLATGAHSPAGVLTLDLKLTGWHRLHIAHNPVVRIWLEGETGYRELPGDSSTVGETEALCADFTSRRVCLAPVRGADCSREVTVFYLRAEPCAPPSAGHRNLVATNDGHGVFCHGIDAPEDLRRYLVPFRDSDFFRILWGTYGGGPLTLKPGSRFTDLDARLKEDAYYYDRDRVYGRSLFRMKEAGIDPLAVVRQATRAYGLELHYYFRMAAFYGPFPHVRWTTRFFAEHPEWRCRDEHGREVNMISYAFPGVQDYVLAYFEELLDYDPDGLCLAFNRGLPLMICEAPVIEAFRKRHGRAPRLPEECDTPEFQAVRFDLLAGFVERANRLVAKRGKALSCIVPRDFARSRQLGLDIEMMTRKGLFESVMVGAGHRDDPALAADLAPVLALKSGGTRVYGGGSSVRAHGGAWMCDFPEQARRMSAILDAGLDGGFVWDADVQGRNWPAWKQFGNRKVLERIMQGAWPKAQEHETRRIHDLVVGRYNPWHAY
ncbi:MAG: hypothetical protein A2498_13470 [Lentisphaerae bacterium RIFOXYC12_FULL_60_16]|nr:MAG: hypothetical protein A2498_13470 [Lentisphaerae bacterium RIFOXYC12_FULL_60_16]OGV71015.1 MAG: hypothetical protein A2269_07310 [Lentisphaerae bacterium RIFOXYA12_FULL_60_10]OGV86094.1 MAG: hypothetical protein A2340_12350 [Lentisphaerae bacterium RIFOXYB12_FULL_60_10]